MIEQIIITLLSVVLAALVTYFITSISARRTADRAIEATDKAVEAAIRLAINVHNEIKHKEDTYDVVERRVNKHELTCNGNARLSRIEKMLVYVILKIGGNLSEVGLNDPA